MTYADAATIALAIDKFLASYVTSLAIGVGLGGLALLFLGIKLVRLIYTLAFVGLGAWLGLCIGLLSRWGAGSAHAPWISVVVGGLGLGLLGFLLYRIWLILSFGALMAAVAAGAYLATAHGAAVRQLGNDALELCRGGRALQWQVHELVQPGRPNSNNRSDPASSQPGPGAAAETDRPVVSAKAALEAVDSAGRLVLRTDRFRSDLRKLLRASALWMSLSAVGGLALGLLIAGFAWRLAGVLLTSVIGLALLVACMGVVTGRHWPEMLGRVARMGWPASLGPAGLWLMGVSIQALLARRGGKPGPVEPAP